MEGECCNNSNNLVDDNNSRLSVTSPMPEDPHNHAEQCSSSATPASAIQVASAETKAEPKEVMNIQKDQNEVKSRLNEEQMVTVLLDPNNMSLADRILISRSDSYIMKILVNIKTHEVIRFRLVARKIAVPS
jgi:hypothetical protein